MILAVEAMSRFLGSLNRLLTIRTAQGTGPTLGRSPPSSTLLAVASSYVVTIGILPIVAGLPAPHADQDRGVSRQSACASLGPLSSA